MALAIKAFLPRIKGNTVKVFTHNKGVIYTVNKGSMIQELQSLSLDIFRTCKLHNIDMNIQWVPRKDNSFADELSREIDFDDWGVSPSFFKFIDNIWGPHTVDRFADDFNCKLSTFNSKFWCPGTSHVDAFSTDWSMENNWLVPPISQVSRVLKHVRECKAKGTLVIPAWPSASFWPLFFSCNNLPMRIVANIMRFNDPINIFVYGRNQNSVFGSNKMMCQA